MFQKWCDDTCFGIDDHNPVAVVGHENAPVAVNLQAIRLSVILDKQLDLTIGRDTENSSPGNVNHIKNTVTIE